MSTIPASQIVQVNPSVLGVGGSAVDMIGLMLTTSSRPPIGSVLSFPDAESVSDYFGGGSAEAAAATIYFNGFTGAPKRPAALRMAQYPSSAVAAYLRGGDISQVPLSAIQAISGQMLITVNGTLCTLSVDLSSATSLSNAASLLQTLLQAGGNPDSTCVYDSVSGAFVITSPTTGALSTITFASGSGDADTVLKLTEATGAVLSQGADAAVPSTFMNALVIVDATWANFMTIFDPDSAPDTNTNKLLFAAWTAAQDDRFGYVCWDDDSGPTASVPDTGSMGYQLEANNSSGICLIWSLSNEIAAFILGAAASIDFEQANGRITFAFKEQSGLDADVSTAIVATNLGGSPQSADRGNGYNFYGAYGAANTNFVWFQRGFVTGRFAWFDSYVNQMWLNRTFQLALLTLLQNMFSIPFNRAGYALVENAMADVIQAGLSFGAYAPGEISQSQKAAVNAAAGLSIADALQVQGYYLQVAPASSAVRAARGPVNVKFWYLDRGSIQSISLDSIAVQ